MMTTLRVGAMSVLACRVCWLVSAPLGCPRRRSGCTIPAENTLELGQVADLEFRRGHALGESGRLPVDPGRWHAHAAGPHHVDVRSVAHEEGLPGGDPQALERALEDHGLGLAPADFVGDD